ncbi:hypothetical protein SK128_002401 [Halocaridina rubra]|uniref:Uncharacterized protein n=1 Tax=Halocaridina rubra TaxID=373956 RepID=A0AAN9A227_HALRR
MYHCCHALTCKQRGFLLFSDHYLCSDVWHLEQFSPCYPSGVITLTESPAKVLVTVSMIGGSETADPWTCSLQLCQPNGRCYKVFFKVAVNKSLAALTDERPVEMEKKSDKRPMMDKELMKIHDRQHFEEDKESKPEHQCFIISKM